MCGICGFSGEGDPDVLAAMTAALAHRGPDGDGQHVDPTLPVSLGHRRLAIIDVAGGSQPMWNGSRTVCVVFNGEIYNHRELRATLVARGHAFATDHSDTEVLVHGYAEWGDALPVHLEGMFAFAVLDRSAKRLLLARDRFGEKPLYYVERPGLFAFASELTALLAHPGVDRSIDRLGLAKLFAYGFIPAPHTHRAGVRKLPPGHTLRFDLEARRSRRVCYWDFRIEPEEPVSARAEAELPEQLAHLLDEAVRRRLEADVPLGLFLSGGIDSAAVLAMAGRHRQDPLNTFTIGFEQRSFDESAHARDVARALGARHHEKIIDLDRARALIPSVLRALDEPTGDSSILPTFLLAELARSRVTVALSGDGGDELFAGYDPFKALVWADRYQRVVPRPLHSAIRLLAARLPLSERNMSFDFKLNRALRGLSYPPALWNPIWLGSLEPPEIAALFGEPFSLETLYSEALEIWDAAKSPNPVDRTLEFYTRLYLADDILAKTDRAGMMVSLEVRAPFLDRDLVDFARRLPHRYKLSGGVTKHLLRRALTGAVPGEVLARRKKGFGIPLARWLRELPERASPPLPHLDAAWLRARWADHRRRRADYRHCLWNCIAIEHAVDPPGARAPGMPGTAAAPSAFE